MEHLNLEVSLRFLIALKDKTVFVSSAELFKTLALLDKMF